MYLNLIKNALLEYYSKPLIQIFKQFRLGLICFGAGIIGVLYCGSEIPPSLKQEITVFSFLILTLVGFVIAMLAQIRMLITRIVQFTRN